MSLYDDLGLASDSTQEDIKIAFRNLSKEHHPDVGGDENTFKKLSAAYDILSDEDKRKKYDELGDFAGIDDIDKEILARFTQALNLFLQGLTDSTDWKCHIKNSMMNTRANIMSERLKFLGLITKMNKVNKSVDVEQSRPNIFKLKTEEMLKGFNGNVAVLTSHLSTIDACIESLDTYNFEDSGAISRTYFISYIN